VCAISKRESSDVVDCVCVCVCVCVCDAGAARLQLHLADLTRADRKAREANPTQYGDPAYAACSTILPIAALD
jgi:hypothetical protein